MDNGRRKRLISLTIALIVVVPLSVLAARWQWHRHIERDAMNEAVTASEHTTPVPWQRLGADLGTTATWRRVTATGTWDVSKQLLVRKSVVNGEVGFTVLTPFRDRDGSLLCVERGWVSSAQAAIPPVVSGTVTVTLRVRPVSGTGPVRPADLPAGQINRVDPRVLGSRVNAVFELLEPLPTGLVALPWPELTSGPHLSYFVQWILIGCTAVVVYVRVLALEVRRREDDDERTDSVA